MSELPYFLFSPASDQATAIARYVHRYKSSTPLVGVVMPGESQLRRCKYIAKTHKLNFQTLCELKGNFIPTGAVSTKYLLENIGDIRIGQVTLTKDALRVFDKMWLLRFAESIGLPVPFTTSSLDEIKKYPIFYKQNQEMGGGKRGVACFPLQVPQESADLIFQEYIDSVGTYGVGFIADKGVVQVSHVHFESESFPKDGGSAIVLSRFEDQRLIEYTNRLIQALNYSGWGLVEFKYCNKRQDYVLMEINPKFWASCELAFINEPKFLKLLFDIDAQEAPQMNFIFVHRAFLRGLLFILVHLCFFIRERTALRFYPRWWLCFIIGILPRRIQYLLKNSVLPYLRQIFLDQPFGA